LGFGFGRASYCLSSPHCSCFKHRHWHSCGTGELPNLLGIGLWPGAQIDPLPVGSRVGSYCNFGEPHCENNIHPDR
jgi:hypothetical protein